MFAIMRNKLRDYLASTAYTRGALRSDDASSSENGNVNPKIR